MLKGVHSGIGIYIDAYAGVAVDGGIDVDIDFDVGLDIDVRASDHHVDVDVDVGVRVNVGREFFIDIDVDFDYVEKRGTVDVCTYSALMEGLDTICVK